MKPLATEFFKKGFGHKQLRRKGMVAMFQRWKETKEGDTAIRPHFEVVVITANKGHNGYELGGKQIPAAPASEGYPSSEQWGSKGFTFNDEEAARLKFNTLAALPSK